MFLISTSPSPAEERHHWHIWVLLNIVSVTEMSLLYTHAHTHGHTHIHNHTLRLHLLIRDLWCRDVGEDTGWREAELSLCLVCLSVLRHECVRVYVWGVFLNKQVPKSTPITPIKQCSHHHLWVLGPQEPVSLSERVDSRPGWHTQSTTCIILHIHAHQAQVCILYIYIYTHTLEGISRLIKSLETSVHTKILWQQ